MRQTYFAKPGQVNKSWHLVDADGQVLGRLASKVATVLMGKHRPEYTPHIDCGEFVIITNASKVVMTGDKGAQRRKSRYTGYAGGFKTTTFGELLEKKPEFLIEDAVKRMLPKGILGRQMLKKLRVFKGAEHPHQAQQPVKLEL